MKLKEAIKRLRNDVAGGTVWRGNRGVDLEAVISELRAYQREKREMFAKLSPACSGLNLISETCKWRDGNPHCTLRACPLLKKEDGK